MANITLILSHIADALQVQLGYKDGTLTLHESRKLSPVEGLTVTLTPKVVSSIAGTSIGALIHVVGDLYVVLSGLEKTGAMTAILVDGKRCKMAEIQATIRKDSTIREVFDLLKPAILKSFMWRNSQWIPLKIN